MKTFLIVVTACVLCIACKDKEAEQKTAGTTTDSSGEKQTPPAEFADPKYVDLGKKMLAAFEAGNITEWTKYYSEDAVYNWSSGDSLAGRPAIEKYWMERRGKVIDSIKFSNDIWIPLKVNTPQRGPDAPGIWLLNWYQVDVKYKSGKKLMFWVHSDHHFNANDQIDRTIHYIDMAPIKEAVK